MSDSKRNSIAVCGALGNDLAYCHGLLQTYAVIVEMGLLGAEGLLRFYPQTEQAREHLHLTAALFIESGQTPQIRGDVEC